jgi:SAM-dependent methyltransferase
MSNQMQRDTDVTNRPIWARDVELFAIEGWLDPGELAATVFVADIVRGEPILDIGVGAGRTIALLRLISSDYRAIDYVPEMIDRCRALHPTIDVRHGDARDLRAIGDDSCGLVVFSSNGIDAVDHAGRRDVFASVRRVLRPGGVFFFSTLNKDSALYGARPGSAPEISWIPGSLLPATGATAGDPGSDAGEAWGRAVVNWRRLRSATEDHGEWGIAPFAAHEFGLLTHFVTVKGLKAELAEQGFELLGLFACEDGAPISGDSSETMYMHVVASSR